MILRHILSACLVSLMLLSPLVLTGCDDSPPSGLGRPGGTSQMRQRASPWRVSAECEAIFGWPCLFQTFPAHAYGYIDVFFLNPSEARPKPRQPSKRRETALDGAISEDSGALAPAHAANLPIFP
jgi:hypothetical protein